MKYYKTLSIWFISITALISNNVFSQVSKKFGTNAYTINTNAVLELESTNKGFLLPRISLSMTTNSSPLSAHVAGMTVYNIATVGDVSPGYYYNDGTKWVRIGTTADGSETKVTAGSNVTVTGTGTTGLPYVVGVVDATTTTNGVVRLAGDLSGNAASPSVVKLQGQAVSATAPTANQSLVWNGTSWTPTTVATNNIYTIDGTLTGNRTLSQGMNSLAFTSSATTGTSHFSVDGNTLNVDAVNNRVGFGTNVPNAPIEVYNGTTNNAIIRIASSGGSGNSTGIHFSPWGSRPTAGAMIEGVDDGGGGAYMRFSTINNGTSVASERMRITNTGRLGIGTTSPSESIHLDGGNFRISGSNSPFIQINTNSNDVTNAGGYIEFAEPYAAIGYRIKHNSPDNIDGLYFQRYSPFNTNGILDLLTILQDGKVGIGNITPTQKLDVTGNVRFSGALMPNNLAGTAGQVLTSAGAGVAPTWSSVLSTEVDGVIGNEVTDATVSGGLTRSGTGTAVSPFTLGVATGGISTSMLADGSITAAKINQMSATSGQVLSWNGTAWAPTTSSSTNIYNADGTLTGNRILSQGTNSLAFTSTATTGTSHFTVDGTTLNVDAVNNRVGIGTNSPSSVFSIVNNGGGDGVADDIELVSYGIPATTSGPTYFLRNSRGSATTPVNLNYGDYIGNIIFSSRAAGSFQSGSIIQSNYRGNGTTNLSDLVFHTSNTLRMTINENGVVSLNNLSGTGTRMVVADANGVLSTQSVPSLTEVDGVIGNEVTDATVSGGLTRSGTGTAVSPFTLGVATGGISTAMLADGSITAAKINQMSATSGQVLSWNGTAWAPTTSSSTNIYNADGTLTGNRILSQGTNSLAFTSTATTGTSHFTVDGTTLNVDAVNNRVGIGTNSPSSVFSIVNNGGGDGVADDIELVSYGTPTTTSGPTYFLKNSRGSATTPVNLNYGDYIGNIIFSSRAAGSFQSGSIIQSNYRGNGTTNLSDLVFHTSNTLRMTINENGNIGIGSDAPTERLDVSGNVRFSGSLMPNNQAGTAGQVLTSAGAGNAPTWSSVASTNIYNTNGTLTGNRTVTQGTNTLAFNSTATTGTSHFTVDGTTFNIDALNNRVGFGTSTPISNMEVSGTNTPILTIRGNGLSNTDSYSQGSIDFYESGSSTFGSRIVFNSPSLTAPSNLNRLEFKSIINGIESSSMIINQAGNIGVGTLYPSSTLETNGTFALNTATSGTANSVVLLASGTFTPPTASTVSGRIYIIRNTSAATNVTVASVIDYGATSATSFTLTPAIGSVMIISDGTSWFRIQ